MGAIWLTSDTHFGHQKVAELRGFDSVEAHDRTILHNLSKIPSGDVLWHLGDVAMGGWKDTILPLRTLPFDIHAVLGNHDRPHPSMSSAHNHLAEFQTLGGFKSVQTMATIRFNGEDFLLSHFPYSGDTDGRMEERFTQYRLRDEGKILIHGHTHSSYKWSSTAQGTSQIHVGLDAWNLKPVRLADVLREFDNL